ncbi:MAG TPA: hypothetical protein VHE30_21455 [Polyangiaceae bacterium]|nr:hypothetical protein [Polyangiaceae bacterium]
MRFLPGSVLAVVLLSACSSDTESNAAAPSAGGSDPGTGGDQSASGGSAGHGGTSGGGSGGSSTGGVSPGGVGNAGTAGASGGSGTDGGGTPDSSTGSGADGGATPDSGAPVLPCGTDCSELDGDCTVGVCDADAGTCSAQPKNEGGNCDDRNPCVGGTTCASGVCGGGAPTCALPTGIGFGTPTDADVVGAKSGDFSDACPAGQLLIGWGGTYTQSGGGATLFYLASAKGECATPSLEWSIADEAYVATASGTSFLPPRGTDFFATYHSICPVDEFVVGVSGHGYGGGAVVGLDVSCARLLVRYDAGTWKLEVGTPEELPTAFKTFFYDTSYAGQCPAGELAVGQHGGNYGNVVGGLGVSCAAPSLN